MPSYTHKMAIVSWPYRFCDVNSSYVYNSSSTVQAVIYAQECLQGTLISRAGFKCVEALGRITIRGPPYPGADLGGGVTRVISNPPGAAAYFMLLLCMQLKLFRCRFVPLLEPNPDDKRSHFILP